MYDPFIVYGLFYGDELIREDGKYLLFKELSMAMRAKDRLSKTGEWQYHALNIRSIVIQEMSY